MMKDYYRILEIHPDASPEVVHNAYRALVRKVHPDLYHSSDKRLMEDRMQTINEAYNILSNPRTRMEFDHSYRRSRSSRAWDAPSTRLSASQAIRRVLLWGLVGYALFRFLFPLLAGPLMKVGLLILLGMLVLGFFVRSRRS